MRWAFQHEFNDFGIDFDVEPSDGHWNEDEDDTDDGDVSVPETSVKHESRLQSVLSATLDPSEHVTDFRVSIYLRARKIAGNIQ